MTLICTHFLSRQLISTNNRLNRISSIKKSENNIPQYNIVYRK